MGRLASCAFSSSVVAAIAVIPFHRSLLNRACSLRAIIQQPLEFYHSEARWEKRRAEGTEPAHDREEGGTAVNSFRSSKSCHLFSPSPPLRTQTKPSFWTTRREARFLVLIPASMRERPSSLKPYATKARAASVASPRP